MAVRSRRLCPVTAVNPASGKTLYTVPVDRTLIVRCVIYSNTTALALTASTLIGVVNAGGFAYLAISSVAGNGVSRHSFDDDVILNPGDQLISTGSGLGLNAVAFGSLLAGAPV